MKIVEFFGAFFILFGGVVTTIYQVLGPLSNVGSLITWLAILVVVVWIGSLLTKHVKKT